MSEAVAEIYVVVSSDGGHYSIWRADRALPEGWTRTAWSGAKDECLARIASLWTDIRPQRQG
jgi:MbtH protein